jgi:transposase
MARQGQGLDAKPATGAKRRLSDVQLRELETLLLHGATAHGFPNELWTSARVALVIERRFGIKYHPDHALKLLKQRLHWTCHKPQKQARERNDKEVERWKADEFPRILRDAWRRGAHVAFLDESGFMLAPLVRRTLAPQGQRVKLVCSAKHDKISVISCVTLSPQARRVGLYYWPLVKRNFHGEEVVEFLQYLTHKLPGAWTVVWDRNKIHKKSKVVRAWLAKHPEVVVEDFPVYAPNSNPDEWVWSWSKYGKLCNLCPADVEILYTYVMDALMQLKQQPSLLASFVISAGVPLCL